MASQVCEMGEFEKLTVSRRMVDILALERPGEVMRNEDGIEPSGKGGIDVGLGAVADHPCGATLAAVMRGEAAVSRAMLFRQHLDGAEVRSEAGAVKLVGLLGVVALGDEDETVARGKLGKGLGYVGKKLDLLIGDGLSEADDAGVFIWRNRAIGKLLEAGDERLTKAGYSIATRGDGGSLDAVEPLADLFGAIDSMVEIRDE